MQTRLATLQRLVALYLAVEEMHLTELQRMTAAVREAELAIGVELEATRSANVAVRGALLAGDRASWMVAESQRESAAWRRRGLEQIRLEREGLNDAAREQYVASRLKRMQIQRVFDDIAARMAIEEGRRMQAVSDDRFLARRRWTDSRDRVKNDLEMNSP
jgi:hypothetical protein